MPTKDDLRAAARATRAHLAAAHADFVTTIARFADDIGLAPGVPVASYWPFRDEADPRRLAAALGKRGHPLLLPCVAGSADALTFRRWREGDALRSNAFGVSEPMATSPAMVPRAILVPLLAFDAEGFRLGYGGGYYDRTLAQLRRNGPVLAVGVAYAGQQVNALLHEAHDQKLDSVITEEGIRRFAPDGV